jgi:CheY-like chemotaxis protein
MTKEPIDVLVIDDDPDLCLLMESMLQFAGHHVRRCTNPLLIQHILAEAEPRMILMDMLLSGTDGRDVTRAMKQDPATTQLKIMMISAHPDAEKTCRDAGADEFLGKPFDMDDFLAKVSGVLATAS